MNLKRFIAGLAVLVLAGAASLLVSSPVSSQEHDNSDGHHDMEHGDDMEPTTTAPADDMEPTTTAPADDGGEEPAPEVPGEPGFTG